MLITPDSGLLLATTQHDHAHLSGEILSLWRSDGLPEHPRRGELVFAAREHDNGWREVDSAPYVDRERGRPHDFLSLPRDVRFEIWRRGARRYAGRRPYAALLITHHALQLHQGRHEEPEFPAFLAELAELHQELVEETGAEAEDLAADYRFLDVTDFLSLVVANRWEEPFGRQGFHGRLAGDTLFLSPFPLAGTTAFTLRCRKIPDRFYASDSDLALELAQAAWIDRRVRLAPLPG